MKSHNLYVHVAIQSTHARAHKPTNQTTNASKKSVHLFLLGRGFVGLGSENDVAAFATLELEVKGAAFGGLDIHKVQVNGGLNVLRVVGHTQVLVVPVYAYTWEIETLSEGRAHTSKG